MNNRSTSFDVTTYVLAFVVGAGTIWLFMVQLASGMFAPGNSDSIGAFTILMLLSPFAGLAVFQLIFGLIARRWRGVWFWLYAPMMVYLIIGVFFFAAFGGYASALEAVALVLICTFAVGLFALLRGSRTG
ncbi:hypothetical protein [Nitratireductor sp. ZSWI3]|uniref:hypothetical protein n=1 Tax=Nitratireductor sp. ZSWI3 TaxID=2966359 RepID=UPI0021503E46|nr:hypothetical protein [Nitratireductor sp. ZSWI3]MCR4264901.1 hypothetical protein [Nitratireductor sp. ZSWI3]